MKKNKVFILLSAISLLLVSCGINALISCGSVTTLNTDLGYVDVGGLNFGNLLLLDTINKAANNWKVISYQPSDLKVIESGAYTTDNIQSGLTVTLSGSGASDAIAAGVNTSLANQLNFRVVNYKRTDFVNPVSVLNEESNKSIIQNCKDPALKGQIVMLITSVTNGDSSQIYLGKNRAAGLNASSEKVGKVSVNVTYSCSGTYEKSGNQVNLFFRSQFFMCDPEKGLIDVTAQRHFDLTKYSFVQGFTSPLQKK